MPNELQMPRSDFMYRQFVDENVKKLVEEATIWEGMLTHQAVNAMNVRYFKEQYVDIETPNDAAMSRPIDYFLKNPAFRAPGSKFPHTGFGEPKEYNLGLYQLALEIDVPDEAQKYVEMENMLLRSQTKLANSFASKVNAILGTALTENWAANPSSIQSVSLSGGYEWTTASGTNVNPVRDILDAAEKIIDLAGYAYKPSGVLVSQQAYFDLRQWIALKNLNYKYDVPVGSETPVLSIEGYPIHASNMVKRDFAVVADFNAAGTLFQAEPFATAQYYTQEDRVTHVQAARTFNYALSDPKAVCLIVNTSAV